MLTVPLFTEALLTYSLYCLNVHPNISRKNMRIHSLSFEFTSPQKFLHRTLFFQITITKTL